MGFRTYLFIAFAWIMMTFTAAMVDGAMGSNTDLNTLASFDLVVDRSVFGVTVPVPNIDYFKAMVSVATWNFSIFSGDLLWVRFLALIPLTLAFAYGLIVGVGPVLISLARLLIPFK